LAHAFLIYMAIHSYSRYKNAVNELESPKSLLMTSLLVLNMLETSTYAFSTSKKYTTGPSWKAFESVLRGLWWYSEIRKSSIISTGNYL